MQGGSDVALIDVDDNTHDYALQRTLDILRHQEGVTVIVGDVVGHGICAALMMASIRAMIRCRSIMHGTPVDIITDVNRLLCRDTCRTGNFSTLFYLTIDRTNSLLHWIRCGHDPAGILGNEEYFQRTAG